MQGERKEVNMPRKGSKQPYKPRVEYKYTVKDVADLAGMSRIALNVAKVRGRVDPGDFKSVVSFLTRRIIEKRLEGNLFPSAVRRAKRARRGKSPARVLGKKPKKAARRK
jgi:hypothetical protein